MNMGFVENINSLATTLTEQNIINIQIVVTSQADIAAVAQNIASVINTSNNIADVNIVSSNISNVNAVAGSIDSVDTLAPVAGDIDTLSQYTYDIHTVAVNVDDVVTTSQSITDVQLIANDLQAVGFSNIDDLGLITDPVDVESSGGVSYIQAVAQNIDEVVATGTNISDVVTVSSNIDNVNTVANDIANVNLVATQIVPNLAEVLLADDSAAAAAASAAQAAATLDEFDDRYLGSKAVEPTLDNDGDPLLVGALYFDTVTNKMRVWDGTLWSDALTLTAGSISTMVNKTIDDIRNYIGANHIHHEVRNVSGSTILKGTVVTAQGAQSGTGYVEVVPVTNPQTQVAIGIMHTTVTNNGTGLCMNTGVCKDVTNTSAWAVGTILYPNASGGLTSTKPTSGVYQACAIVLRSHNTQGTLLVEFTEPKNTTTKIVSDIMAGNYTLDMGGIV